MIVPQTQNKSTRFVFCRKAAAGVRVRKGLLGVALSAEPIAWGDGWKRWNARGLEGAVGCYVLSYIAVGDR